MAKYWLFRFAAVITPRVPLWIARPFAVAIGTLLWAIAGNTRRRAIRNLRHAPTLAEHPDRLSAACRGVFQLMALNYLDFFRGRTLSDDEVRRGWTIENVELFERAKAQGRGVILLTGHLGNWEFAASRLGLLAGKAITPAEHMRPERLFELFCSLRNHHGVRIVPGDSRDALRSMLDTLKAGGTAMMLADRYVLGASAEVTFFGEPAKMPTGPFALALRSEAAVLAAFTWSEGSGRSHGVFVPVRIEDARAASDMSSGTIAAATRTRGAERIAQLQQEFLRALEMVIAEHPEQWVSALAPVWEAR